MFFHQLNIRVLDKKSIFLCGRSNRMSFFIVLNKKIPTCKSFVGRTNAWKWFYVSHPRQTDSVVRSEAMQGRALWKMEYWLRSCYGYISYKALLRLYLLTTTKYNYCWYSRTQHYNYSISKTQRRDRWLRMLRMGRRIKTKTSPRASSLVRPEPAIKKRPH